MKLKRVRAQAPDGSYHVVDERVAAHWRKLRAQQRHKQNKPRLKWKVVSRPKVHERPDTLVAALADTVRTGKAIEVIGARHNAVGWLYAHAKKHGLRLHSLTNGAGIVFWAEKRR
jgi:hypothetical protein